MSLLWKLKFGLVNLSLLLCSLNAFGGEVTIVYFVPFEIETYVPITQETITAEAWEKWTISSKTQRSRLFAILNQGGQGKFDEKRVRVMVRAGKQTYFIDSDGVVLRKGKLNVRIDKAAFVRFRDSLRTDQRQETQNRKIAK